MVNERIPVDPWLDQLSMSSVSDFIGQGVSHSPIDGRVCPMERSLFTQVLYKGTRDLVDTIRTGQGTLASAVHQIAYKEPRFFTMNTLIIFSAILATAFGRPGVFFSPQVATYAGPLTFARLVPGAPIGLDGRVVDTPEVAVAKAEHAAAHINERINLANEAVKSADVIAYASPIVANGLQSVAVAKLVPSAPVGPDGRVVDTPEVALAKAEHAAAHINEKIGHNAEADKSSELSVIVSPVFRKYLI